MEQAQTKSERTRQFIIEATADIFNKKGYAGTSLSDLTEATKLTKGSIYGNFGGKEEVAVAAFEYNWNKLRRYIDAQMKEQQSYHDKLLVYTVMYKHADLDLLARGGCPVLNTATEADDTNPMLKQKAAAALRAWKEHLMHLIRKGIEAGEFRADIDLQQAALSMIALIEGSMMIIKLSDQPKHLSAVLKTLETYIDSFKAVSAPAQG